MSFSKATVKLTKSLKDQRNEWSQPVRENHSEKGLALSYVPGNQRASDAHVFLV